MRYAIIATILAVASAPAFAADAPAAAVAAVAHSGDMLRDANNLRLGAINAVNKDGSVGLIFDSHYVTVPGDSLTVVGGKLTTKLTKAQVSAL